MPKSITVEVNPEVMKWLRNSSGWKIEEVAKRLNTTAEVVTEFESGKKSPMLNQLKILSASFKYPLASFFLSKPKEEKPRPKDYRFLPNRKDVFDKKTILAIRKSRSLQSISKELSLNIEYETKTKIERSKLSENPDLIAAKYRKLFNLDLEKQINFKDAYKLFNYLRDILEDMNVLVFKFSMPIEDARGFALTDEAPAIIVINSKDTIEARLFSLMHEFGHVLLGETIIDIPEASLTIRDNIERWCNAFSSSFLLPAETARKLFEERKAKLTGTETLNTLSKKYKMSKAALLVKMVDLKYISRQEFESVVARYNTKETKKGIKREKKGGIASDKRCLSEVGNKFISLVANNFDKNFITYTDALSYLSIKSKNFEKVLVKGRK
jgi:Zn-dependent peptidase ImmA (M78 family)/DNA-binding XRE family transcriptional regulator